MLKVKLLCLMAVGLVERVPLDSVLIRYQYMLAVGRLAHYRRCLYKMAGLSSLRGSGQARSVS